MLRGIRLIIYDLDGTLIDTNKDVIFETVNRVITELGEKELPESTIEDIARLPFNEAFQRVLPETKHNKVPWCLERYREVYTEIAPDKTSILPDAVETLTLFKKLGIKQSIATLKHSNVASKILGRLNLLPYFDLVLGVNDVVNPKPAPDLVELTLTRLQVEPRKTVLIDDSTIGLEAGKKAGVYTVGVTTGDDDREKLETLDPDYIVDGLRELTLLISP
jgi:HAD superfamily hydrolase (TIGR01509 family)